MAYSNRFCNPTPFKATTYWGTLQLVIPPFQYLDLEHNMAQSYRPDAPGFESVNETIGYHGLFLLDYDKPYDVQALENVRKARMARESRIRDAITNLRNERSARGIAQDETAIKDALRALKYDKVEVEIETLKKLEKSLEDEITKNNIQFNVRQYDPKRTIFVMNPITEFPSEAAMKFFLSMPENAEIAAKHYASMQKSAGSETAIAPPPKRGRPSTSTLEEAE